jgi:hypothetical protein
MLFLSRDGDPVFAIESKTQERSIESKNGKKGVTNEGANIIIIIIEKNL